MMILAIVGAEKRQMAEKVFDKWRKTLDLLFCC